MNIFIDILLRKNSFAEVSKNLDKCRYKSESNFLGSSK